MIFLQEVSICGSQLEREIKSEVGNTDRPFLDSNGGSSLPSGDLLQIQTRCLNGRPSGLELGGQESSLWSLVPI